MDLLLCYFGALILEGFNPVQFGLGMEACASVETAVSSALVPNNQVFLYSNHCEADEKIAENMLGDPQAPRSAPF